MRRVKRAEECATMSTAAPGGAPQGAIPIRTSAPVVSRARGGFLPRAQADLARRPDLNILFIGKYALDRAAGDAVSVRRLTEQLSGLGIAAHYRAMDANGLARDVLPDGADVVHALNAEGPARVAISVAQRFDAPLVVTTTGTDLDSGAIDPERRVALLENLERADHVVVLSKRQRLIVESLVPGAIVTRITQGVTLVSSSFDLRRAAAVPADRSIALMLGGLRPVKGHHFALDAWERCRPETALVIAGDRIDGSYAAGLEERVSKVDGVVLLPAIRHADVMAALRAADVLLNTSESEGESRAILEAMTIGTPVVARNNDGNRALVGSGAGLLFDDAQGLCQALDELRERPRVRASVVQTAFDVIAERRAGTPDAEALAGLYRTLVGRDQLPARSTPRIL